MGYEKLRRHDLSEVLFKKQQELVDYPDKVKPVKKMLDITAFFPGGRGLWLEEESTEFPSILVLGQDFSTVKAYEAMVAGNKADLDSPTWKNLIKLFDEAKVDLHKCFFTNVFMGLRDTEKMTGQFPGRKDNDFVNMNLAFLLFQILTIKPNLIITLGIPASEMVAKLSRPDLEGWDKGKALSSPDNGYKTNISLNGYVCNCVALEHTSMRNSNVKRRVYGKCKGHEAEVEMLKDALKLS
jgi:uracil-DNA glycosylase